MNNDFEPSIQPLDEMSRAQLLDLKAKLEAEHPDDVTGLFLSLVEKLLDHAKEASA